MVQVGEGVVDPLSTVVRVEVGESPGGVRFAAKRAKARAAQRGAGPPAGRGTAAALSCAGWILQLRHATDSRKSA